MLLFYDRKHAVEFIKKIRKMAQDYGYVRYAMIKEINMEMPEEKDYDIKFKVSDIDYFFIVPDKHGTGFFRICYPL